MLFIALSVVSSFGFILSASRALWGRTHRRHWVACALLIGLGELCWLTFALSESYVDQQNILREPFNLVPLGALLVGAGIVGIAWRGFRMLRQTQRR